MPFLFEVIQKVSGIYYSLNNMKHQFDLCLNHLSGPAINVEILCATTDKTERKGRVKGSIIHHTFHYYLVYLMIKLQYIN